MSHDKSFLDRIEITELLLPSRIGGSDSVVSALAGTTFHILNPSARQKHEILKAEVRSHFKNYEDIKYSSAQRLPYLNAVIREGLRIFPPGHGMPRISPGAMVSGFWVPKGVSQVRTARSKYNVSNLNFRLKCIPVRGPSAKTKNITYVLRALNQNAGWNSQIMLMESGLIRRMSMMLAIRFSWVLIIVLAKILQ